MQNNLKLRERVDKSEKTVGDVMKTLTEEQRKAVDYIIFDLIEKLGKRKEEDDDGD